MADADEPKKETVRINLPPRGSEGGIPQKNDTVRINLPPRPLSSELGATSAPVVPRPGNVAVPRPPVGGVPAPTGIVPPPQPAPSATMAPPSPAVTKTPVPRPIGATEAAS